METNLVASAREGDRVAMQALLESIAPTVHRFALRMCKSTADADDVVQDTLLSITQNLHGFEGRSTLASWVFTLARSACSRRHRGAKNQPGEDASVLDEQPAEALDPEQRAATLETAELVARALDALPPEHREVILLRDAEGLSAKEAVDVLGLSIDALKSRLHRARAALREALRPILERDMPQRAGVCPDVVTALSKKLEDDLDPSACAEMEKHVEGCAACARTCDTLKEVLRACRAAPAKTLPPELDARVRHALECWLREARKGG